MGVSASFPIQDLPQQWRSAPRRWGHPLHSLCSYFAMFPPQLAHFFVDWLTQPGEAVYDPFSGRGTVPLEAVLQGRRGYGSDANPLAVTLSRAKTKVPSKRTLLKRLAEIEASFSRNTVSINDEPENIAMLYSDHTLKQLVWLKDQLDRTNDTDCFWIATILGMLHGNHNKTGPSGFSISMPNTFAMAPRYVAKYIREHGLVRPEVNVFDMLKARLERLDLPTAKRAGGKSWTHDATEAPPPWLIRQRPKLVFTSPPYLQVIKYGQYNWVRLWFLGETSTEVDKRLMASASLSRYLEFMRSVSANLKHVVAEDGYVCFVIGDVRRGEEDLNLAQAVWDEVLHDQNWHLHGIIADEIPQDRKVSRIWKHNSGRATKVDRLLLLSPTPRDLPDVVPPSWTQQLSFLTTRS
ncbi:DNA methyltransferase [Streptomyces sp. DSM 44917]|uniref:DNA methyltransferase n=1 Tax=Streptomyces boetiae TaxID=3075541 RepID=A0ABU2L902_9ACTN|nr:DNA methyltransferase [Streptomyces sp. DSM 44917]MDT0308050.1 DNA methyltransferase [Streptomyces sp. DSM 44917]